MSRWWNTVSPCFSSDRRRRKWQYCESKKLWSFFPTGDAALAFLPLRLVRDGGNALQVSGAHGEGRVELTDFFWNKRYLAPLYGGCVPARDFPRLFDWHARGELEVDALVSHRHRLEQLQCAFDDMLAGHSSKSVLVFA